LFRNHKPFPFQQYIKYLGISSCFALSKATQSNNKRRYILSEITKGNQIVTWSSYEKQQFFNVSIILWQKTDLENINRLKLFLRYLNQSPF